MNKHQGNMQKFKGLKRYNDIVRENSENSDCEDVTTEETNNAEKRLSYEIVTRELSIPDSKKDTYDKLIKKISRYCKFINFPLPKQKEKGEKFLHALYSHERSEVLFNSFDSEEFKESLEKSNFNKLPNGVYERGNGDLFYKIKLKYYIIELTIVDEVKPLEEWTILGTIDYREGIVNPAPGKQIPHDLIPGKLRGTSYCSHCNSNRQRNKIVFIKNEDSGEIIQVGGSCIKYYLGYDYEKVLQFLEGLTEIFKYEESYIEDSEYSQARVSYDEPEYSVSSIIKYYIYLVKSTNSHMSKKQTDAYNDKVEDDINTKSSTSEHAISKVLRISEPPSKSPRSSQGEYEHEMKMWTKEVEEFDKNIKTVSEEEYNDIVNFVESKVKESNFMFNVSNKIKEGFITSRFLNYIAGACSYFFSIKFAEENKARAKKSRDEKNAKSIANSNYIGVIGEKIACEKLTIKKIKGFETQFGWSNVYNLEDESGNIFVKFGTINKKFLVDGTDSVEEGSIVSFTADVKKHGEFNNIKQTTLGRLSKFNTDLKY